MSNDLLDQLSKYLPSKLMDRVSEALAARQPVGEVPDKGPWEVCAGEPGSVISDDFTHDVMLRVHGDFGSDEALANYCTWLVGRLNAAPPQQPAQIDLEQFRQAVHDQYWYALGKAYSSFECVEARELRDRLLALIDSQGM